MVKRSRGWIYTVWMDGEEGRRSPDEIVEAIELGISKDSKIEYAIFGLEEAPDTGRKHLQGFVYWTNAVTGRGAQRRLGLASGEFHAESQRGTHAQASDYAKKDAEIIVAHGEIPDPEDRPESAWDYILIMLENGATDSEIMRAYPAHFGRCKSGISAMRMELLAEKLNTWREVEVEYIWGPTGTGKTRGVLESVESPQDVYRVTDYSHPFDGYRGQQTLLLEEFRSSLPIEQMLVYLDGYYHELPCRYSNKVSGWSKVYIVTNIPMDQQYRSVQERHPETWAAWIRRIDAQVHKGHLEGNNRATDECGSPLDDRAREIWAHQAELQAEKMERIRGWEESSGRRLEGRIEWQPESGQFESSS